MKYRIAKTLFSLIATFSLTSCASNDAAKINIKEKGEYAFLDGVKLDYEHAFFDDFSKGVNPDSWYICKSAWGDGNGGVIPDNVMYTDDGILVLRGNGLYYSQTELVGIGDLTDGKNTGGVLISTFNVGPGHYESKFKPLPRLGSCTAFWTFANKYVEGDNASLNHEIDIEMPGGASMGVPSFKRILDTNWTKENAKDSTDVILSEGTNGKVTNLNDGNYHVFGFDWYTNPKLVVYYIDGVITRISDIDSLIPTLTGKLWIGNWFPTSFVGRASFETDYMLVDYVSYVPFLDQPSDFYSPDVSTQIATKDEYPTYPVALPVSNYASNGDFEFFDRLNTQNDYGWEYSKLNVEHKPVEDLVYLEKGVGYLGTVGAVIKDGGILSERVDSVYEGMKYNVNFKAKSTSSTSALIIDFLNGSNDIISSQYFYISSNSLTDFSGQFTAPEGTNCIDITICNETGVSQTTVIDNIVLSRV